MSKGPFEYSGGAVGAGTVTSVFGRTGDVVAQNGDYTASQVTNVPAGNIAATNVQAAINELDTEKAPTFTVGISLDLTASVLTRAALTGDVTASANANATTIANNAVTNAKFRQSAGLSVVGRAAGTTGNVADITATSAGQFLGYDGSNLVFGNVVPGSILVSASPRLVGRTTAGSGAGEQISVDASLNLATLVLQRAALTGDVTASAGSNATTLANSVVTNAKMANMAANTLKGNGTASPAAPQDLTLDATLTNPTTATLGRAALTGDVTAAAGSNATVIGANKVTSAMLRQSAALSVVGNATNATANVTDIAAGTDGFALRRSGTALGFGTLAAGAFAANTAALSVLANAGAQYDIVGRKTASAGAWEDCTRADLNLARTDAANTLTSTQTTNAGAAMGLHPVQTTSGLTTTDSVVVLESTDAGASGPTLARYHNSASPAANDAMRDRWYFNNTSLAPTFMGQISFSLDDATLGAEKTHYTISTMQNGVITGRLNVGAGIYLGSAVDIGAGTLNAAGVVRSGQFTVGTLPAAATVGAGARASVTDSAAAPVFSVAAVGGGTLGIPVTSDGTIWRNG